MSCAKTAELAEMLIGVWTRVVQGTMYWFGVQIATGEGHVQHGYGVGASWDVLDGVHFGAIWQM